MKVLVADDNKAMLEQLCALLETEGYIPLPAQNGEAALSLHDHHHPDFICLDIEMGSVSGYDVCREIRKKDADTPIIFITARTESVDKVIGLELGADDYISKPFDIIEVKARIRAVARRCLRKAGAGRKNGIEEEFTIGSARILPASLRAEINENNIDLSLRDVKILRLFHDHRGQIISRDQLIDHAWGAHIMPESRTVDWHISQLRKKIERNPAQPEIIKTVHGAGYKYE